MGPAGDGAGDAEHRGELGDREQIGDVRDDLQQAGELVAPLHRHQACLDRHRSSVEGELAGERVVELDDAVQVVFVEILERSWAGDVGHGDGGAAVVELHERVGDGIPLLEPGSVVLEVELAEPEPEIGLPRLHRGRSGDTWRTLVGDAAVVERLAGVHEEVLEGGPELGHRSLLIIRTW
jgi:hypothetical protein